MALYSWQNIQRRIKDINYPIGAEIGVDSGVLSNQLLSNIPRLTLHMVDAWSPDSYIGKGDDSASAEGRKRFTENCRDNFDEACRIRSLYYSRAHIVKMPSLMAADLANDEFFDFVFIDACHDYGSVKDDIMAWLPKIKRGGYICGHDYNNSLYSGVKRAVDEIFGTQVEADSDFTWFMRKI
jgi:hypothetical protein